MQKNHCDGEGLCSELEENGRFVRFIHDGDRAVLEGTDENTMRYIRGYELVSSDNEAAKTYYHYAPDELDSITHVMDEDGNVINRYDYDAFGNSEGGRISYAYDAEDRIIYEAHEGECISSSLTYAYDKTGNLVSVTDADGHTETYDYDLLNRETRRTARDGGVQETLYDKNGNAVRRINPVQYLSDKSGLTYSYDLCNRLSRVTSPAGSILEENTYNAAGDLLKRTDGMGNGVSMAYDLMGRRLSAATAAGSSQQWEYDAIGNVRASTDGLGNRTEFTLDKWGRITGIRKADGSHESYTYDLMGNMTSSTDGEGHTTLMEYDTSGQMVKRTDPSGKTEYYGYDREKRLVSSTDRNGSTTRYTYNMYGSLTGRVTTSADRERTITESFGYYPDGRLKSATAGGMRYDYAYDAAGRLKTKRASGVSLLSYEYDLNGNRIGMTDVTGKHTAYRYNSLNQLEEITDSGRSLARYSYNADGTIKRLEVGNSLVTEYGYDADRNITSQKTVMTGMPEHGIKGLPAIPKTGMDPVTMVDNTYTYDGNANRITKNTLSGKTGFGYDSANRLVRAEYSQFSEEYRYDRAGNRISRNRTGKGNAERGEETYSYDACNRLTVHDITGFRNDGTQENIRRLYTYDMQGNMLSDGDRQYSYDVRNRLAEVRTADGSWQKNHYDGEGLRAELEENGRLVRFIYDGDKAVLEGTDENTIRHIRGYELVSSDSEAAKTYYHYASDELGSITHVTDEDGNVLNRYEYDAFGNFTLKEETVENRFGFAGEQYDPAANLYYLRARFYNPVIGRFIQEDTYYGDGLNLYTYCHNNPVGYVDPSGHEEMCANKRASLEKLRSLGINDGELENIYESIRILYGSPEETLAGIGQNMVGTGEYRDVKGHHVHAKAGFRDDINYSQYTGFSISDNFMRKNNLNHSNMTAKQRQLFKELYESGRPNTLAEHTRIAMEVLKAGGANETLARDLVTQSLINLGMQHVNQPTRIPWYS